MGISENYVKAGALLALVPDYYDNGKQAGEMAVKIIDGGIVPQDIKIRRPRKHTLIVNQRTSDLINLEIPAKVKSKAKMMKELRAKRKKAGLVEYREWVTSKERLALIEKLKEIRGE